MKAIFATIVLVLFVVAMMMVCNWQMLTEHQLVIPLGFNDFAVPIGYFFSILLLILLSLFLSYIFFLHTSLMIERKKFLSEIFEQKKLVEKEELSRLTQLKEQQHTQHQELMQYLQTQHDEAAVKLEQLDKAIAVSIESLEDRIMSSKQ